MKQLAHAGASNTDTTSDVRFAQSSERWTFLLMQIFEGKSFLDASQRELTSSTLNHRSMKC